MLIYPVSDLLDRSVNFLRICFTFQVSLTEYPHYNSLHLLSFVAKRILELYFQCRLYSVEYNYRL